MLSKITESVRAEQSSEQSGHINPKMVSIDWVMEKGLAIIETNGKCNLGCLHCNIADENLKPSEGSIEISDYLRFIEMYSSTAPKGSNIILKNSAGSLGKNELILLEEALKRGLFVSITTEGITVPRFFRDKIEELNRDYHGRVGYTVSLDGSTEEIHRRLRKNISFERVVGFIKYQLQRGIYVETNFVAHEGNLNDLEAYVRFCAEDLGVKKINILPLQEVGAALQNNVLPSNLVSLVDAIILTYENGSEKVKKALDHTIAAYVAKFKKRTENTACEGCPAGSRHMLMIDCRGDVYPCNSLRDEKYKIRNISGLVLDDLYESDRFRDVKESIPSAEGIESPLNFGCPKIIQKRSEEYKAALLHLNSLLEKSGIDTERIEKQGKRICYARTF